LEIELGSVEYRESKTWKYTMKPQYQLYFDKFDCYLFKQREKHVALSKILILFNNP